MPEPQTYEIFQMYAVPAMGGKKAIKLLGCSKGFLLRTGQWTAVIVVESVDPALATSVSTFTSSVALYSLI